MDNSTILSEEKLDNSRVVSNDVKIKNKRSPFKFILLTGCLFFCCIITLIIGGLILTNADARAFIEYSLPVGKYQEPNSTLELNKYLQEVYSDGLKSLDFSKLNKENPIDILAKDKAVHFLRDNEKLNKLNSFQNNIISGKTQQYAFDSNLYVNSLNPESNTKSLNGKLTSDIFISYPNYDYSKFDNKDIKKSQEFLRSLTLQEVSSFMPKVNMIANIEFIQDTYSVKAKIDITYADKALYIKISDLQVPEQAKDNEVIKRLILSEGKLMKIDISKQFDQAITSYIQILHKNTIVYNSWDDVLKDFNQKLKAALLKVPDSDIQLIQRVGNPIRDVLIDAISNTKYFNNINSVQSIRNTSDSVCSQGDLDLSNILDVTKQSGKKIFDIIKKDPNYKGETDSTKIYNEIDKGINEAQKTIDEIKLNIKINTCTSKAQNYLTGYGIDLNFNSPMSTSATSNKFTINLLMINPNSDKSVVTPREDVDITDQVFPKKTFDNNLLLPSQVPSTYLPY